MRSRYWELIEAEKIGLGPKDGVTKAVSSHLFEKIYRPYLKDAKKIILDPASVKIAREYSNDKTPAMMEEARRRGLTDIANSNIRTFHGALAELAVDQYNGLMIGDGVFDQTVGIDSRKFHKPDFSKFGFNLGVKTAQIGNFPTYGKGELDTPQLITIVEHSESIAVYVLGITSATFLKENSDLSLILSPSLREKGTKFGFFGVDFLDIIDPKLENLKTWCINYKAKHPSPDGERPGLQSHLQSSRPQTDDEFYSQLGHS